MTAPRGLTEEEAEAWEKVAATVAPLHPVRLRVEKPRDEPKNPPTPNPKPKKVVMRPAPAPPRPSPPPRAPQNSLDSSWDKKLKSGSIQPDFTLDLHGHGLDAAYDRLMSGVGQARAMGARTILLVTGKPRPVDPADRGSKRGAIRAKVLDWLAASSHHAAIAAVRRAHIRHGGDGALYIVLRRERG